MEAALRRVADHGRVVLRKSSSIESSGLSTCKFDTSYSRSGLGTKSKPGPVAVGNIAHHPEHQTSRIYTPQRMLVLFLDLRFHVANGLVLCDLDRKDTVGFITNDETEELNLFRGCYHCAGQCQDNKQLGTKTWTLGAKWEIAELCIDPVVVHH